MEPEPRLSWALAAMLLIGWLAAGCGGSSETASVDDPTPWPITAFPDLPEVMNDVPEARIELGRLLFFDPVLSVDDQTACATCHSELWGMGDGIARAIGHGAGLDAGPRRTGPNTLRRNSQALYNLAFRSSLLWDGRENQLEEQVLVPLFSELEMGADEESVLGELTSIPEYQARFADAFPDDPRVSIDNMASALAAYQRTFVSNRSTYDAYAGGRHDLMDQDEIEGMVRFAEMGCDDCHTPPLFESETFADRNVAEVEGIVDHGLEEHSKLVEDRAKFRTPTLRNLASTEPYFHNGSVKSMFDAIRHELALGDMPFTEGDVRSIAQFIDKTLRDEMRNPIRPLTVPSGLPLPIDPAGPAPNGDSQSP